MAKILRLKLDVTKLDKSAFFKGAKGTYADLTVYINDRPYQYDNDASVQQDLGKDRRQRGEKGPYVGNGKWSDWKGNVSSGLPETRAVAEPPTVIEEDGDLPF